MQEVVLARQKRVRGPKICYARVLFLTLQKYCVCTNKISKENVVRRSYTRALIYIMDMHKETMDLYSCYAQVKALIKAKRKGTVFIMSSLNKCVYVMVKIILIS